MPTLCALCENVVIVLKSGRFVAAAPVNFKFKRINDGISHTVTSHQLYSPISCGQNIPSRETRAKSARIWELREPWVVAELEPVVWTLSLFHHDATLWAPRWMDALGFSLQFRVFLSCHLRLAPGHGSSSRAQSRHGSYTPAPKRQEASTLSEQISGQEDTTANRHGTNGTNNKHVVLYPVIWYAAYFHRCGPPRADCQYQLRKVPARFLWILLETQLLFVKSQCRLHVSWSETIRFYSKEVKYCHVEKSGYNRGIVHSVLIRNYVLHVSQRFLESGFSHQTSCT